jgi:hypothetical protein
MSKKTVSYFIIGTFVSLYLMVSVISTIHVIDFFKLSNPTWLAVSLAIAFEIGAAASLASLISLDKMNKGMVWSLFIILTLMQAMGNTFYAYTHLQDFQGWVELFGLDEEEQIYQKRALSIISGAVLPVVALGFIKSLVDYIKPEEEVKIENSRIQSDNNDSDTNSTINEELMDFKQKEEESEFFVDGLGSETNNTDEIQILDLSDSSNSNSEYDEKLTHVNRNRIQQDIDPTKL